MQTKKRSHLYQRLCHEYHTHNLRREMALASPLNVVIGAGGTAFEGWFSTDSNISVQRL
jgi:hypothetical protein